MGDEGKYVQLIERVTSIEQLTPEIAHELTDTLQNLLKSRPRDKNQWHSSYDTQVASAEKKPKTRYSFNSFTVIIAEVNYIIQKLEPAQIDTAEIKKLRDTILGEIDRLRTQARKITTDITNTIPSNLHEKYGRETIWKAVAKGAYADIAGNLAELRGEDLEIHINKAKGNTIQTELARIKTIKQSHTEEVTQDLSTYHEKYRQQIMDPIDGATVSDELVDKLERLVDITVETLNHIKPTNSIEYKEAA